MPCGRAHKIDSVHYQKNMDRVKIYTHDLNAPISDILINENFGSFKEFKYEFTEKALEIHGSGWIYLNTRGNIGTIANHKVIDNIALIIDMWEHSYLIDFGSDKKKYLQDIWKIINFDIVNARLN